MKRTFTRHGHGSSTCISHLLLLLFGLSATKATFGQAVTEVITDYNGYWKSAAASPNAQKPANAHNLLAFTYNGTRYSTGVNNSVLATHSDNFVAADFWSLPVAGMTGTVNSNTKVGLGALYDGVANGPSNPVPEWGIYIYLTDGQKGLGLGTCIANLPVGSMSFQLSQIQPSSIGDGVPDILVTQIADPSGSSFDRYEFVDAGGVRVGNYKDIVFTNIQPVGTWTADFYEASHNPLTLAAGFTQTDRPIRLWAADLSEFGITAANCGQIKNFKINLCGNSDVAFVAYNNQSIQFIQTLPVQLRSFGIKKNSSTASLTWEAGSEQANAYYSVERSLNGRDFVSIARVEAKGGAGTNRYFFIDADMPNGSLYYRLRVVDDKGRYVFSRTVALQAETDSNATLRVWPNPAFETITITHRPAAKAMLSIVAASGLVVKKMALPERSVRNQVTVAGLAAGTYHVVFQDETEKTERTINVQR